mmetsp:Transcript_130365/g.364803  ORF Transcript_130365/g.364803 Transcript_130365/m.364803 type:complete len:275 (+) Transcript_130365:75-899(+)
MGSELIPTATLPWRLHNLAEHVEHLVHPLGDVRHVPVQIGDAAAHVVLAPRKVGNGLRVYAHAASRTAIAARLLPPRLHVRRVPVEPLDARGGLGGGPQQADGASALRRGPGEVLDDLRGQVLVRPRHTHRRLLESAVLVASNGELCPLRAELRELLGDALEIRLVERQHVASFGFATGRGPARLRAFGELRLAEVRTLGKQNIRVERVFVILRGARLHHGGVGGHGLASRSARERPVQDAARCRPVRMLRLRLAHVPVPARRGHLGDEGERPL